MERKAFFGMLHRDLVVTARELPYFLLRVVVQPLLFALIFGRVLPEMGQVSPQYSAYLLPGIVATTITFSAMQGVAMPLVAEFGWTREIEGRLLAPVGTRAVAAEKLVMGTLQGLVAGGVVFPISWLVMPGRASVSAEQPLMLVAVSLLAAYMFSALGLTLGTVAPADKVPLMFSLVIMPITFLGCAYYPWAGLARIPWLQKLVLADPMAYASEGFRAALVPGLPHMDVRLVLAGLIASAALFTWAGLRGFERRALE